MKDLKNMKAVNDQIQFDKRMTLTFSILGGLIGVGCFIWAIDVLLG